MLNNKFLIIISGFFLVALTDSTRIQKCKNAPISSAHNIKSVTISNCDSPPCELKHGETIKLVQHFVPSEDIQTLTTSVYATIALIPLPFIGVNGFDACDNIYNLDDTKQKCPLKQGVEYIYKNEFPIIPLYPNIQSLVVYWALVEKAKIHTCFEVLAKIT